MSSVDFGRNKEEIIFKNDVVLLGAYTVNIVHYDVERRKCIFLLLFLLA